MVEIAHINALITELMQKHRAALAIKHINDERTFRKILCRDYEKILHALVELKTVQLPHLLTDTFFSHTPTVAEDILSKVINSKLNHIGFEIIEPIDLVLHGIVYWVEHLNKNLDLSIEVKKYLRFPASQNFQRRVNAATEILCIWLQVEDQVLMLEFFDIARSHEHLPADKNGVFYHMTPEKLLLDNHPAENHKHAMQALFGNDSIWHYSVGLATREHVDSLHEQLGLLAQHHAQYQMAYSVPIENKNDGTYHTKIINLEYHLELELCHISVN